jgi:hypothetical protein
MLLQGAAAGAPTSSRLGFIIMRVVKLVFGVLCFGIGAAFAVETVDSLLHPQPLRGGELPLFMLAMFAAMFLLGSVLLLRRSPKS